MAEFTILDVTFGPTFKVVAIGVFDLDVKFGKLVESTFVTVDDVDEVDDNDDDEDETSMELFA